MHLQASRNPTIRLGRHGLVGFAVANEHFAQSPKYIAQFRHVSSDFKKHFIIASVALTKTFKPYVPFWPRVPAEQILAVPSSLFPFFIFSKFSWIFWDFLGIV